MKHESLKLFSLMYKAVFKVLYMSKLWGLGVQHSKENIFALQSLSLNDGIKEKEITFKDDAMSFLRFFSQCA